MTAHARVHDLTALLVTHMPTWPTSPPPVFEPVAIVARDGVASERIVCGSHTGTHMDAPAHFIEDGATVDRIPPETLVAPAAVLDLRREVTGPVIEKETLAAHWPKSFRPEVALLETGWSHRRAATRQYLYEFPGISSAAAEWLVQQGVRGVGTDTLGIDPYSNTQFEAHKVLLSRGIWVLEALDHLDELSEDRPYTLVAAPLKIAGAGGAMARVFALEA